MRKEELGLKDSTLTVKVPSDLYDAFIKKVNEEGLKRSDVLKDYIYEYIDGFDSDNAKPLRKPKKFSLEMSKTYLEFRKICKRKDKTMSLVLNQLIERYLGDR